MFVYLDTRNATQRGFDVGREPGDAPAAVIVREERSVSKTAVGKQTNGETRLRKARERLIRIRGEASIIILTHSLLVIVTSLSATRVPPGCRPFAQRADDGEVSCETPDV